MEYVGGPDPDSSFNTGYHSFPSETESSLYDKLLEMLDNLPEVKLLVTRQLNIIARKMNEVRTEFRENYVLNRFVLKVQLHAMYDTITNPRNNLTHNQALDQLIEHINLFRSEIDNEDHPKLSGDDSEYSGYSPVPGHTLEDSQGHEPVDVSKQYWMAMDKLLNFITKV